MSIFGEIGLDSSEIPEGNAPLPDGQYTGHLFNFRVMPDKKNPPFRQVMFTYKVDGSVEGQEKWKDRQQSEFFRLPPEGVAVGTSAWSNTGTSQFREKVTQSLSFLKTRLKSLGVPENMIASVDPSDLVGTEVIFNIVTKNGYTNVQRVAVKPSGLGSAGNSGPVSSAKAATDW